MMHFQSPAVDHDLDRAGRLGVIETSPLDQFSPSGLAASAQVDTQRGPVAARDLEVGDLVITRDGGFAPIRWIGESMTVYAHPEEDDADPDGDRGPVRVKAGALGTDPACGNLVLNAGHRLLVANRANELLFGTDEVLVEVGDLTHLDGVDFVPRSVMRFRHVLLDSHELIRANGIWMESFTPEMWAIRVAFPDHWEQITDAVPRLRFQGGEANYVSPRQSLNRREAKMITAF